jgi:hypothetical protein
MLASSRVAPSTGSGIVRLGAVLENNRKSIWELAKVRPPVPPTASIEQFESRMVIVRSLIEMRKAGIFRMVYCDRDQLAVVLPGSGDIHGTLRQKISWIEAFAMVEEFNRRSAAIQSTNVERKPPARSETPKEAKKWAK